MYTSLFKYMMEWTVFISIQVYYELDCIHLYSSILWNGLYSSLFKYIMEWTVFISIQVYYQLN